MQAKILNRLIGIKYPNEVPGTSGLYIDTIEGIDLRLMSHIVEAQVSGKEMLKDFENEAIKEVRSDTFFHFKNIKSNKVLKFNYAKAPKRTDDVYSFGNKTILIEIETKGDVFERTRLDYIEFYSVEEFATVIYIGTEIQKTVTIKEGYNKIRLDYVVEGRAECISFGVCCNKFYKIESYCCMSSCDDCGCGVGVTLYGIEDDRTTEIIEDVETEMVSPFGKTTQIGENIFAFGTSQIVDYSSAFDEYMFEFANAVRYKMAIKIIRQLSFTGRINQTVEGKSLDVEKQLQYLEGGLNDITGIKIADGAYPNAIKTLSKLVEDYIQSGNSVAYKSESIYSLETILP